MLIGHYVKKITKKTKTDLDDIIVDQAEEPIVIILALLGCKVALTLIVLPANILGIISMGLNICITIIVGWGIFRLFNKIVNEFLDPLAANTVTELDDQILVVSKKGVNLLIIVLTLLIAISNAGCDIGALIATLGIGGLAFALAAQDTIGNLFGGITIIADRPFKINDRVQVQGHDGVVIDIGLRSTRIRTIGDNRIVTIPNSMFTNDAIKNISSEPSRTIDLNLGLTYDTTVKQLDVAMKILENIVKSNDKIDDDFITSFDAFNDFSLNIMFRYYIKSGEDVFKVQTEINREILQQYNDNKLDFAFPTQTILAEVTNK